MNKLFMAEAWIEDAADMMDLCAPDSILKTGVAGAPGDGEVEPHGESPSPAGSGTRTSTKKCGSPMRASGRAPGP